MMKPSKKIALAFMLAVTYVPMLLYVFVLDGIHGVQEAIHDTHQDVKRVFF